jgi:hypothetical protein
MPPEVVAMADGDGDGDGQDRERYSPFAWDVFSMGMVGDRLTAGGGGRWQGPGWLTALRVLQVQYYMWTGRHPLDEYTNVFTIIREIGEGSRWAAHRRARACTSAAGETSHDSAALPPTPHRPVLPPSMSDPLKDLIRSM